MVIVVVVIAVVITAAVVTVVVIVATEVIVVVLVVVTAVVVIVVVLVVIGVVFHMHYFIWSSQWSVRAQGRAWKPHFAVTAPRVREGASFSKTLQFELAAAGRRAQVFHLGKPGLEKPGKALS